MNRNLPGSPPDGLDSHRRPGETGPGTAALAGLVSCLHCGHVHPPPQPAAPAAGEPPSAWRCPRCRGTVRPRKDNSLARTWALLLAAAFLYIPANLLPVMQTTSLLGSSRDTILSGVVYFWTSGSPGLALLIFTVSVAVPLAKLGALAILAWCAGHRAMASPHHLGILYRVVEQAGRWSMLDIFVIALMVGMVHFQGMAVIEAGPGAAAFGAVVVLSMLAASSFDPRLLWDQAGTEND